MRFGRMGGCMQEVPNTQQNGGNPEAALEAHRIELAGHEIEFLVDVIHHPDHEPRHIRVRKDATLLDVLDESARKLDVKLLPNPHAPHHRIGEPLDLGLTVEDFLRQEPETHHLGIELVLAIEINTRWRIAPEKEMTPNAI